MINSYNRSNPMIELLSKQYFKVKKEQSYHTKNIIKQNFIILATSIIGTIITSNIFILVFIPIYAILSIILLKIALNSSLLGVVEEIFIGDIYKVQNINEEKIFELLSIVMKGEGMLKMLQNILVIIFSAINVIIAIFILIYLINYLQNLFQLI